MGMLLAYELEKGTERELKSLLKIVLTEENGYIRVCFFNNGKNPTLPVREGGGLGALRIRLEEAGGSMQILTTPEFCLSVLLPKKGGREVCYRYRS